MTNERFDDLLARMPEIAEVVQQFQSEAMQTQVLMALLAAHGSAEPVPERQAPADGATNAGVEDTDGPTEAGSPAKKVATKAAKKTKSSSSAKQSFDWLKDLDLHSQNPSFRAFAEDKDPATNQEKGLVAVYWLTRIGHTGSPATIGQVYTCFKEMDWTVPGNLANALQQAGSKGWLDSATREDLKVPTKGENYVEKDLPKKKAAKA